MPLKVTLLLLQHPLNVHVHGSPRQTLVLQDVTNAASPLRSTITVLTQEEGASDTEDMGWDSIFDIDSNLLIT